MSAWLDSCLEETLLPSSPWHKVRNLLELKLTGAIEKHVHRAETRQALFHLVGPSFVRQHFSELPDQPLLLEPPVMRSELRDKIISDMKAVLLSALSEGKEEIIKSSSFKDYSKFATQIYRVGIGREVTKATDFASASLVLSQGISTIIQSRPDLNDVLRAKLIGHFLPVGIRRFVWRQSLLDETHSKRTQSIIKENAQIAGLDNPKRTELNSLIQRVVVEIYGTSLALSQNNTFNRRFLSTEILNMYYVYSGDYEARNVNLTFPLILALYDTDAGVPASAALEATCAFARLVEGYLPAKKEVIPAADRVINRLKHIDAGLLAHSSEAASKGAFDHQEFLTKIQSINKVHETVENHEVNTSSNITLSKRAGTELLQNPVIFVRKWFGEAFVGILNPNATLFVWDQCFLAGWHTLEDVALIVLLLLRDELMRARNYYEVRSCLLDLPARLMTKDLIQAYQHLKSGFELSEISSFNKSAHVDSSKNRKSNSKSHDTELSSSHGDEKHEAAVKIQAAFRGMQGRRASVEIKSKHQKRKEAKKARKEAKKSMKEKKASRVTSSNPTSENMDLEGVSLQDAEEDIKSRKQALEKSAEDMIAVSRGDEISIPVADSTGKKNGSSSETDEKHGFQALEEKTTEKGISEFAPLFDITEVEGQVWIPKQIALCCTKFFTPISSLLTSGQTYILHFDMVDNSKRKKGKAKSEERKAVEKSINIAEIELKPKSNDNNNLWWTATDSLVISDLGPVRNLAQNMIQTADPSMLRLYLTVYDGDKVMGQTGTNALRLQPTLSSSMAKVDESKTRLPALVQGYQELPIFINGQALASVSFFVLWPGYMPHELRQLTDIDRRFGTFSEFTDQVLAKIDKLPQKQESLSHNGETLMLSVDFLFGLSGVAGITMVCIEVLSSAGESIMNTFKAFPEPHSLLGSPSFYEQFKFTVDGSADRVRFYVYSQAAQVWGSRFSGNTYCLGGAYFNLRGGGESLNFGLHAIPILRVGALDSVDGRNYCNEHFTGGILCVRLGAEGSDFLKTQIPHLHEYKWDCDSSAPDSVHKAALYESLTKPWGLITISNIVKEFMGSSTNATVEDFSAWLASQCFQKSDLSQVPTLPDGYYLPYGPRGFALYALAAIGLPKKYISNVVSSIYSLSAPSLTRRLLTKNQGGTGSSISHPVWTDFMGERVTSAYADGALLVLEVVGVDLTSLHEGGISQQIVAQGWAVLPLFSTGFINTGAFRLPLLEGPPSSGVVRALSQSLAESQEKFSKMFQTFNKRSKIKTIKHACLDVVLADGALWKGAGFIPNFGQPRVIYDFLANAESLNADVTAARTAADSESYESHISPNLPSILQGINVNKITEVDVAAHLAAAANIIESVLEIQPWGTLYTKG